MLILCDFEKYRYLTSLLCVPDCKAEGGGQIRARVIYARCEHKALQVQQGVARYRAGKRRQPERFGEKGGADGALRKCQGRDNI